MLKLQVSDTVQNKVIVATILVTELKGWQTTLVQIIEGTETKRCYFFSRQCN